MNKLLILGLAIFLGACGQLPRPFVDQAPQNNPLLKLEHTRPLAVEPPVIKIGHEDPREKYDLALWIQDHFSQALRDQDLPAANDAFASNSLHINIVVETSPFSADKSELKIALEVTETVSPTEPLIVLEETTLIPSHSQTSVPKVILAELLNRASLRLSDEILALDQQPLDTPLYLEQTHILLSPLPDALDQRTKTILEDELRTSFLLKNLSLSKEPLKKVQFKLGLEISQTKKDGTSLLSLVWSLYDVNTDEKIGELTQANPVPNISLSRIIPPAAEAIAEGTAYGIQDLLQQKSLQNQTVLK